MVRVGAGYPPIRIHIKGLRAHRRMVLSLKAHRRELLWLTGWQHPKHNTLWRFYHARRPSMRSLLKHTVRTGLEVGLLDLAVQAIDGTHIADGDDVSMRARSG